MTPAFLDTNVLIRYWTGNPPDRADRAERLLQDARSGKIRLLVTHFVIAEVIWVLIKEYRLPKETVIESLRRLLNTPNLFCDDAPSVLAALSLFESKTISFIDAYHAVFLPARGVTEFYSYDTDFDQMIGAGITRKEP